MNEVQRRQKALEVVRQMDTDAIIGMLETAPAQTIPTPAYDDLMRGLAVEAQREAELTAEDFFKGGIPDPNIKPTDFSDRYQTTRGSEVSRPAIMRELGITEDARFPDFSRVMVAGPGKMEAKKQKLDIDTPETEYLGKLYESDGSDREDHGDDGNWL